MFLQTHNFSGPNILRPEILLFPKKRKKRMVDRELEKRTKIQNRERKEEEKREILEKTTEIGNVEMGYEVLERQPRKMTRRERDKRQEDERESRQLGENKEV